MLACLLRITIILLATLTISFSFAAGDYQFRPFLSSNGFSDKSFRSLFQDSKGFIWMGVDSGGLCKYSGNSVEIFGHKGNSPSSITSNYINDIHEDVYGNIWLATDKGLHIFNRKTTSFRYVPLSDHPTEIAKKIYRNEDGTFFVGTDEGLYRLSAMQNAEDLVYVPIEDQLSALLKGVSIRTMTSKGDDYWIGTSSGLYYYSYASGEFNYWRKSDEPFGISNDEINSMIFLDDDRLLIGSDNGVYVLDTKSGKFTLLSFKQSGIPWEGVVGIKHVFKDSGGVVWIATMTHGVISGNIVEEAKSSVSFEMNIPGTISGLESKHIAAIIEDSNDQLLVATKFKGIFVHDRRITTFPRFSLHAKGQGGMDQNKDYILSAAEDSDGNIWIGTKERGLIRYDPVHHHFKDVVISQEGIPVRRVEAVFFDAFEKLWIGNNKGLVRIEPTSGSYRQIPLRKVTSIVADGQDALWVGTALGIYRVDQQTGKITPHDSKHLFFKNRDVGISQLLLTPQGDLLIGTNKRGLFVYSEQKDRLTNFAHDPMDNHSISGNTIRSIHYDKKGRIWVGTKSSGLCLYEDNKFTRFYESSGLPSNSVFSILEDGVGNIWLGTNEGLSKFSIEAQKFQNYTARYGLQGNVFERNAALHLKDGRFFIGGNQGFNLFQPETIHLQPCEPPIVINEVRANAEVVAHEIFESQTLFLDHHSHNLTFTFSALDYRALDAIQYKYKLEGVDEDWVYANNNGQVTYSNLSHGTYSFQIMATNADGIWSDKAVAFNVNINTPPWLSWWAKIMYFICLVVFFGVWYWIATMRASYKNRLQIKQLELNQVEKLNRLKLNFFTNISHELRTPLSLILAPLDRLRKYDHVEKRNVTLAYKSAKQLRGLLDQLLYFRKVEEGNLQLKVIRCHLSLLMNDILQPFYDLAVDQGITFEVMQNELAGNGFLDFDKVNQAVSSLMIDAFKFTPREGKVTVQLGVILSPMKKKKTQVRHLSIIVSDTSEGIDAKEARYIFNRYYQAQEGNSGRVIGLQLVRSLVVLHKGSIHIKSDLSKGNRFTIKIPIDENVYSGKEIQYANRKLQPVDLSEVIGWEEDKPELLKKKPVKPPTSKRLLIVDDNKELRQYLAREFRGFYYVETAKNGTEGWKKTLKFDPDVVVTDIMMLGGSGYDLCKNIKNSPITSHISVVMLTAKSLEHQIVMGLEVGADAYMVKPFNIDVLKAKLESLMLNRDLLKESLRSEEETTNKEVESTEDSQFISRILEIMEQNYMKTEFSVEEFAYDLYVSRSQLFRKLKSLTGQTPSEYLYSFRIKKSIKMLEEGTLNVSEIARKSGFKSPNSFTKTFTKHMGVSPSKYVRSITAN